jgi:hypothetical protein
MVLNSLMGVMSFAVDWGAQHAASTRQLSDEKRSLGS